MPGAPKNRVTLKDVAAHLGLSSATVSMVINRSPGAQSIPERTKKRVLAAVDELGYRPDLLARSLRRRRSHSIGVLVPNIGEDYAAGVMCGAERFLTERGYFYLAASHRWQSSLLAENLNRLRDRSVDGMLLIATSLEESPGLPAVVVAGHREVPDTTNVVVDHDRAAHLALGHLRDLGHQEIAFLRGHPRNADTADRWRAISEVAPGLGIEIRPEWVKQIGDDPAPQTHFSREHRYRRGFEIAQELLSESPGFTALFAFNDVSAIGAIRAFLDAGLSVPNDVSVVGFDDIQSAPFQNPSLTTIRQPLREIGELAASALLERVRGKDPGSTLMVEPVLVVRDSSGPVRTDRR